MFSVGGLARARRVVVLVSKLLILRCCVTTGQVDSYVTLNYGRESFSTNVFPENNSPEWGEEFLS